jgi:hypothetical protein
VASIFNRGLDVKVIREAYQGVLPDNYVIVHRWIDHAEANLWKRDATRIPSGIGADNRVYVTLPNVPKPRGATGTWRVEFAIPKEMLFPTNDASSRVIYGPVESAPMLNLRVLAP